MSFKASQNTKVSLSQLIPNYASELDVSKTYASLQDLDDEMAVVNVNDLAAPLSLLFPGKIVFVLETKKHYIVDLTINSQIHFDGTIQNLWLTHLQSLIDSGVDLSAKDYFMPNNPDISTQEYIYYELYSPNIVPEGAEDGLTPFTKDGEIVWIKANYTGDFSSSDIADNSENTPTFLFEISGSVCDSVDLFTSVRGYKEDTVTSNIETTTYTSKIVVAKSMFKVEQTEFAVLNVNDLDISFNIDYNPVDDKIKIFASKKNDVPDTNFTVDTIVVSVNIAQIL